MCISLTVLDIVFGLPVTCSSISSSSASIHQIWNSELGSLSDISTMKTLFATAMMKLTILLHPCCPHYIDSIVIGRMFL